MLLRSQLKDKLYNQYGRNFQDRLWDHLSDCIVEQVTPNFSGQLDDYTEIALGDVLWDLVWDPTCDQLKEDMNVKR